MSGYADLRRTPAIPKQQSIDHRLIAAPRAWLVGWIAGRHQLFGSPQNLRRKSLGFIKKSGNLLTVAVRFDVLILCRAIFA